MGLPGIQMWTWALFVSLSCTFVGQAVAQPQYMVTIPAVLEAGAETRFCVNLRQPGETLEMIVALVSQGKTTVLLQKTSSTEYHTCVLFQAPLVQDNEVQNFEVEVRGATFYSKEVVKVMIKVYQRMTFIQTDKPIYLPGQTVHFRVVTMDTKFRLASRLYDSIVIMDADHNRIRQWQNTTSDGKILQLSFSLNSEAREGIYTVIVSISGNKIHHNFKVEKYVLPKFDIKIEASDVMNVGQDEIQVKVCAKYTYGQPVPGRVELQICRPLERHIAILDLRPAPCYTVIMQTEKNGCAMFMIAMSTLTEADITLLYKLHLKATVEEEGTGISLAQEKEIELSHVFGKVLFTDTPTGYKVGSNVEGKVKAVYFNNTPIPDQLVHLSFAHQLLNLTTDSNGIATFLLNTTNHKGNIQLRASLTQTPGSKYRDAYHTVSLVQPPSPPSKPIQPSVSSLRVKNKDKLLRCDEEENFSIQYTLVGQTPGTVDVMYLILSRGTIVTQGLQKVEVQHNSVTEGEVSFKLKVSPEMTPEIRVVAYTVLADEIMIAHSEDFSTEKCFSNKVSLEFSPSSPLPGGKTTLHVTAQPDSLCGVSAVDQSVLIMEPGKTLDIDMIFNLLPTASHVPNELEDPVGCLNVRQRRSYLRHYKHDSPYTVFKLLGLKMATNLLTRMPLCVNFKGKEYYQFVAEYMIISDTGSSVMSAVSDPPIQTIRTFFPETWIWNLVEVGESGATNMSLTVPDTITTWETEAFCLSPQGFGLAPRKEITVFQPFFLELSLPYSIIRGEHFELKATVFNYLTSCIMVTVTPAPSSDYTLTPLPGDQYTSCLCAHERKTFSWTMSPSVLGVVNVTVTAEAVPSHVSCGNEIVSVPERGRIDVVTRPVIVKAEGTEITKTFNWLLYPKGEVLTEEVELQLPENVIDGSARASLSVLGDILGRALKNPEGLLQMPYGCGEQNMALLAPNIYILQYLKNTQQLTPAIKEKATNFLISGYQRQLNYKHRSGAYSTFGTGVGNTWLTTFVLRSFVRAQSFIYIDPTQIAVSKSWLESKQHATGCFEQSGKLFHNRMKGGVSDEVTLSAYITAAFLEMNMSVTHRTVQRSLSCLRESISPQLFNNTYTTALLAYVFTLAGDMETRAVLLKHLHSVALQQGDFLHWSQTATETSASLDVEISSYVLLTKLSASPTTEDLYYATRIVKWLAGQQNQYGGFCSTQDTVVALQALALYSTLVFSPEGSSTVTVQSSSGKLTFDVNQNNRLLYQEELLQDVTGKFSLEVTGTACAAVQIFLHYNIPTPTDVTTFSVEVKAEANCTTKRPKLTLKLKSLYNGEQSSTNMVILDIKMLSGFIPDPVSLKMLNSDVKVDRVEHKEDRVLVYVQELPKRMYMYHSFKLIQELPVENLKPAVVKIYDYYQPSDHAETEYVHPCAAA